MLSQKDLVNFRGGSGGGSGDCPGSNNCGQSGSTCQVYVRSDCGAGSGYWSSKLYTVTEAQCHYNNGTIWDGSYKTTGYCCSSC